MANIEKISSVVQNEKIVEKINELADGVNSSLKEAPVLSVNGQTGAVNITSVTNATNATNATKATQDGNGNNIVNTYATKEEIATKANTDDVVLKSGDQEITGRKTFNGRVIIPTKVTNPDEALLIENNNGTHTMSIGYNNQFQIGTTDPDGILVTTKLTTFGDIDAGSATFYGKNGKEVAYNSDLTTLQDTLDTHIAKKDNPHSVTKTQVGLGNVANERQYSSENPPPYPVVSVAGKEGAVSLVKDDVGLNNVDNTSDLNKPVSTAQSVAIADAKKAGTDALDVANGKYTKPNDGIPKADLDVGVQASLSKADTALQKAPVTSVNGATGDVQIDVPTKLSELTNDKGFITATVNNLTNYYAKTLTYTKTEVDNLLSAIPKFGVSVVDSLPTTGISSTTVYLITNTTPDDSNLYDEYIYVLGKWEKLGTAKIDLSNYVTVTQLNSTLASYATKTEVSAKYTKPSTGIPKSDLASAVQTSLNKADTALQSFTESDPTVPAWAKQPNKPSYTKSEVGLGNVANERQYSSSNPPPYPVTSVNGEKGAVQITAAKIGALTSIPISTATAIGGVKSSTTGTTSGRDYKVQVNTDGTMKVNVPWTDTNTHPDLSPYAKGAVSSTDNAIARFDGTTGKIIQNSSATVNDNGDIKGNYLEGTWLKTTATTAVTTTQKVATIDNSGWIYYITPENLKTLLGVPTSDANTTYTLTKSGSTITLTGSDGSETSVTDSDTNTTYGIATASKAGLVKPVSVITKPTINTASTTSGRYYHVQMSSDGNMFVNVPWSDTNTTYGAATTSANGLMTSEMVTKLNGISTGANKVVFSYSNKTLTITTS